MITDLFFYLWSLRRELRRGAWNTPSFQTSLSRLESLLQSPEGSQLADFVTPVLKAISSGGLETEAKRNETISQINSCICAIGEELLDSQSVSAGGV